MLMLSFLYVEFMNLIVFHELDGGKVGLVMTKVLVQLVIGKDLHCNLCIYLGIHNILKQFSVYCALGLVPICEHQGSISSK